MVVVVFVSAVTCQISDRPIGQSVNVSSLKTEEMYRDTWPCNDFLFTLMFIKARKNCEKTEGRDSKDTCWSGGGGLILIKETVIH